MPVRIPQYYNTLKPVFDSIQLRKLVTLAKATGYSHSQPAEEINNRIPT
jgi:hypothetical protein